ncbi:MAG: PAS domain S-box protein [Gemmatimonadota bacterium]
MPASWLTPGSVLWFISSHLAISGCTLGILSLRRRFGVGSLWLWVGSLTILMWLSLGAGWHIRGPSLSAPGGADFFLASGLLAPALLLLMLLVHVNHSGGDARRILGGLIACNFLYQVFQQLAIVQGGSAIPAASIRLTFASSISFGLSLAVMTGTFSVLSRIRGPLAYRFGLTLLVGLATDTLAFPLLAFGNLTSLTTGPEFVFSKILAVIILTIPAVFYLQRQDRLGRLFLLQDTGAMAIAGLGSDGPVPSFGVWRAMAETLGDGMTAMVDDHMIFANGAMARIAGYKRGEDMTGLPLSSFVVGEDLDRLREEFRSHESRGGSRTFEWHLRRHDGQVRTLATTATLAVLGSGRVSIAMHRDVTVERETRQQLEASSIAVHALMAGASSLVASLKPEEIIGLVCQQASRLVAAEFVVFFERVPATDRLTCRHVEGGSFGVLVGEEISRGESEDFGRLPRSGARHSLPVLADGHELGLLVVSLREEGRQFSWNELALLDALTAMGAAALRTSGLVHDLTDAEQRYSTLFDQVPAPVWLFDFDTLRFYAVNHAAIKRYGWTRDEFLEMSIPDLVSADTRERAIGGARRSQILASPSMLLRHHDKNGEEFDVLMNVSTVEIGNVRWGLAACVDLTLEQRNQERQQTSLRLESLGRLAGGIAHDFNNILTALQVDLDLLVTDHSNNVPLQNDLVHVRTAVKRAADLTRQILLFSRGEEAKRRPVHLNDSVREIERLLTRSLGETVELVIGLSPANPVISADNAQLHFALVNLCINSRDAMPRGGALKVSTEAVDLDISGADRLGIAAGPVALLTVHDTGEGMPPHVLARALEPFFTTKRSERGTGLGLSIVHGVLTAHDGAVEICSEVGTGTTVSLYFPRLTGAQIPAHVETPKNLRGSETVLLVDDESSIRRAGHRMLQRYGYRVIVAEDGEDALRRLEAEEGRIDLVVTDMVMPRMDARGLVGVMRSRWPSIPVVLSTGYDDGRLSEQEILNFDRLVPKPYTIEELLGAIRETLDGVPSS